MAKSKDSTPEVVAQTVMLPIGKIETNHGQIDGLPKNPRVLRDHHYDALKKSIEDNPEMLTYRELLVFPHKGKYVVIGGNMRLRVLQDLGEKEVPCKIIPEDTSVDNLRAYTIKDNTSGGEWDWDDLANGWDADDLNDWGLDLPDGWGEEEEETGAQEDEFDEVKDDVPTVCQRGDIWQLGDHRLMCGDSLNEADVLKLLNGEHAPLTFTDPPYRLATEGGGILKQANSMKQIKQNGVDEFEPLKMKLYSETNIYSHNKPLIKDYILLAEREGKPYDLAIYKKQGLPNYAGHLTTDLEYIAVIGEQGPKKGLDFETYSKLYVGKKDADNKLSYSKPVALCGKFIMLYSDKGDIILDLFGGSGTTLIAAEQLHRKCYMMELDEHYCDVIIARWEKLTGGKATKITNINQPTH